MPLHKRATGRQRETSLMNQKAAHLFATKPSARRHAGNAVCFSNERPQDKSWSCRTMEEVAMEEEEAMEWEEEEAKEEAKEEEGALLPKPMGPPGLTADIGLG